jgi:sugar phosphate isomerase/epimerase
MLDGIESRRSTMTTRREALQAMAFALATPWMPARRREEKIRLGVASYSLRKFKRPQVIEMVKACGTTFVNLKSVHLPYELSPADLAAARREFDDAGLQVVGSGNNSLNSEKDIAALFDYAKAARFSLLVIAPKPDLLPRIEEAVKKSGIAVAIHNHGPEDKAFPAPSDAFKLIKDLDPRVGICVDVGHTTRTGKDVVQEIADAGPRVLDLHMKDLRDLMDKKTQVPVGDGKMPVAAIFKQLLKMNYAGYVNLEYEIDENDPLPGMRKSFAHLRKVAEEAGGN